jgi:hypothetical protein
MKEKVYMVLFALVKFINDLEEEKQAVLLLIHYGNLPEDIVDTPEKKDAFVAMYMDHVRGLVFHRRSYITAEQQKHYKKMWKKNRQTLSVADLVMCLKREVNTDDDMKKFMIYWEELLPIHCGKTLWSTKERYYTTIMRVVNPLAAENELALITPEHEAFMVLSIENHLARWRKHHERGLEDTGKDDNETNNGLYTSTTSGQNQYGGWSEEGCRLYNKYLDWNIAAREDNNTAALEERCLTALRNKYDIHTDNHIDHQKMVNRKKNAKKRGRAEEHMGPMKKVVRTLRHRIADEDEDEDDDDASEAPMGKKEGEDEDEDLDESD